MEATANSIIEACIQNRDEETGLCLTPLGRHGDELTPLGWSVLELLRNGDDDDGYLRLLGAVVDRAIRDAYEPLRKIPKKTAANKKKVNEDIESNRHRRQARLWLKSVKVVRFLESLGVPEGNWKKGIRGREPVPYRRRPTRAS